MSKIRIAYTNKEPKLKLVIKEYTFIGFHLYFALRVFPMDSEKPIADFLQKTLDDVLDFAERKYGIKKNEWVSC